MTSRVIRKIGDRPSPIEWPSVLLAISIYGGWLLVTWFHANLPTWALVICGGWLVAWHGSLQHETIHGHPFRNRYANALVGSLPLALWLPYRCYWRDHLAHHATHSVTHPLDDPESRYLSERREAFFWLRACVAAVQAPLLGQLLAGPPLLVLTFLLKESRRLLREPRTVIADWGPHILGVAIVLAWLSLCNLSLALYVLACVYPGMALSLLRSFAEHRAARLAGHRIAVVECAGPFALLFLNNNLHAAHHARPGLAWYRLPRFYRTHRDEILHENGGLLYQGYSHIIRRYAFRKHDDLVHPGF